MANAREEVEPLPSWATAALTRIMAGMGGHCGHPEWYEEHLDRRLPLVPRMLDAMLRACPPLSKGHSVCDLLAGKAHVLKVAFRSEKCMDIMVACNIQGWANKCFPAFESVSGNLRQK